MQKFVRTAALVLAFALPTVAFAREPLGCNPRPQGQTTFSNVLAQALIAISVVAGR